VPLLFVLGAFLLVILAAIVLMPLSLVQRYRVGTARRLGRRWFATLNILGIFVTAVLFVIGATITSYWVPSALTYTGAGLAAGALLGLVGLAMTRWEPGPRGLYYTPNRWLVLAITLTVTARVLYGFWRSIEAWRSGLNGGSWFVESGVAGSLAAGAVVLGYYFIYWIGVRRRIAARLTPRSQFSTPETDR
jgi:hypothetical protein